MVLENWSEPTTPVAIDIRTAVLTNFLYIVPFPVVNHIQTRSLVHLLERMSTSTVTHESADEEEMYPLAEPE